MSSLFTTLLSLHVLFGVVGVIASVVVAYQLIRFDAKKCTAQRASWWAFTGYMLSWVTGGWYYWKYYGASVKPDILKGAHAWAHSVFTESKEHVFLFLPFAALVLALLVTYKAERLESDEYLKNATVCLAVTIATIAVIVTLSGVIISGGVR